MAAGDFNGDGFLDLAVGSYDNDVAIMLLGNGDGTFKQEPNCCGSSQPNITRTMAWAEGDFCNNGKLDLAMADDLYNIVPSMTDYLTTMCGNGDGTLTPSQFSLLVGPDTYSMVAGDFNGDGRLDLVQSSSFNGIWVALQEPVSPGPAITIGPAGAVPTRFPPGSTSASVQPGGTATFDNLMVFSLNGFTGTVALSCSGAPPNSTCSVTPTPEGPDRQVNLSAALLGYPFTLAIHTTAPTKSLSLPLPTHHPPHGDWQTALWAALALAGLMFLTALRARRASVRGTPVALLAVLLVCISLAGCNSGASPQPQLVGGTPPGTYTIVATGTSGNITHSATFTVTVQ